jgi:VWFA-related protein
MKMVTTVSAFLISAFGLLPSAFTSAAQQKPTFRSGAMLVYVDAYPTRDGHIVAGLTPADFEVKEDGVPQTVETFEFIHIDPLTAAADRHDPNTPEEGVRLAADPHHRVFVLYFDIAHISVEGARNMRAPLHEFLERSIGSTDYVAVTTPSIPPAQLAFGQQLDVIEAGIDRLWEQEARLDGLDTDRLARSGGSGGFLTPRLRELIAYLTAIREGRTTILVISDAWAMPGAGPSLDEFLDLVNRAKRSNVSISILNPLGLGEFDNNASSTRRAQTLSQMQARLQAWRVLASNTGGTEIVFTNDLRPPLRQLAADAASYYLLGYYTTNAKLDGKYREISVAMKPAGLKVRARRGYTGPTESSLKAPPGPTPAAAAEATLVAEALGRLARDDATGGGPKAGGPALLGAPVWSRATSPRAPLQPAGTQTYRRTERVHIEWPLTGVLESQASRLLDRRGQLSPVPVTVTIAGDRLMLDLNLAPLAAGDYVIEVVVAAGGVTDRRLAAVRVTN